MLELRPGGSPTFGQGWTPSASEVFDRGRLAYPTSVTPKAGSALLICTAAVNGTIEQFSRSIEQLPLLHAVHERFGWARRFQRDVRAPIDTQRRCVQRHHVVRNYIGGKNLVWRGAARTWLARNGHTLCRRARAGRHVCKSGAETKAGARRHHRIRSSGR